MRAIEEYKEKLPLVDYMRGGVMIVDGKDFYRLKRNGKGEAMDLRRASNRINLCVFVVGMPKKPRSKLLRYPWNCRFWGE